MSIQKNKDTHIKKNILEDVNNAYKNMNEDDIRIENM